MFRWYSKKSVEGLLLKVLHFMEGNVFIADKVPTLYNEVMICVDRSHKNSWNQLKNVSFEFRLVYCLVTLHNCAQESELFKTDKGLIIQSICNTVAYTNLHDKTCLCKKPIIAVRILEEASRVVEGN